MPTLVVGFFFIRGGIGGRNPLCPAHKDVVSAKTISTTFHPYSTPPYLKFF
jgi:hypothetical protein